jgi:hypothetical protein
MQHVTKHGQPVKMMPARRARILQLQLTFLLQTVVLLLLLLAQTDVDARRDEVL